MVQMAFCDLSHTYHKQVTNVSPACFCHPTVGTFDVFLNLVALFSKVSPKSILMATCFPRSCINSTFRELRGNNQNSAQLGVFLSCNERGGSPGPATQLAKRYASLF